MQYKAVIIGATTGGPNALRTILKKMPKDFPIPIIIVQRIPQGLFAESLAEALDEASEIKVRILHENDQLHNNEAVLIPGGYNLKLLHESNSIQLISGDDPENSPSISETLKQAEHYFNGPVILAILTGICLEDDLIKNVKDLISAGSHVITQKPETCFIEDLPQTIIQAGLSNDNIDLNDISEHLSRLANK